MRRVTVVLGIAASCALSLAACSQGALPPTSQSSTTQSGSATQAASPQVLAAAYDSTMNMKTAKISATSDVSTDGKPSTHTVSTGVIQFDPAAADLTTQAAGQTTEVRTVNGVTYVSMPGGKWRKIDLSNLVGNSPAQGSPNQALSYLQGASDNVTNTGPATIDGQQTTGYQAEVDLDKVAAKQTSPQLKSLMQYLETLLGGKTIPIKVWIDGQGRLVREQVSMTMSLQGHKVSTQTTSDLTDYGTPVNVVVPSPDQIVS